MTTSVKRAGAWDAGPLLRKVGGAWEAATLYRKVGGVWTTQAALSAKADNATPTVAGASSTPETAAVTATATGGKGPYFFNWTKSSGGDIAPTASGSASTTFKPGAALADGETRTAVFTCAIEDSLGVIVHTGNVTVSLTRWSQPKAVLAPGSLSVTTNAADKTTAAVTATITGGTAPFTYDWERVSGSGITIDSPGAASTTFTATGLSSSGETRGAQFELTVTDANGLTAVADIAVNISRTAAPTASVTPTSLNKNLDSATAAGSTANVTLSASGGVGPFSYGWVKKSGGAITINSPGAAVTSFSAAGMAQGETRTAVFTGTITDSNGDTAPADVTVTFTRANPPAITATYTPAAGAYSATASGNASYTLSCTESATWTWSASGNPLAGASMASGGSGTSLALSLRPPASGSTTASFNVHAVSATGVVADFTITLTAEAVSGGGGVSR